MKILNILTEGIMKVPATALEMAVAFSLSDFFSRIPSHIKSPAHRVLLKRWISEYREKYKHIKIYDDYSNDDGLRTTINLDFTELPKEYVRSGLKNKSVKLLIGSNYSRSSFFPKEDTLTIKTPDEDDINRLNSNVRLIHSMVVIIESTVEHELMHAVQHYVFNTKLSAENYYKDGGWSDDIDEEKYYNTDFEFQPNIVTNAKYFISKFKEISKDISKVNREDLKSFLNKFTSPETGTKFYINLYKKDPRKWKIAVRETYKLVFKEIENEEKI